MVGGFGMGFGVQRVGFGLRSHGASTVLTSFAASRPCSKRLA